MLKMNEKKTKTHLNTKLLHFFQMVGTINAKEMYMHIWVENVLFTEGAYAFFESALADLYKSSHNFITVANLTIRLISFN